MKQIKDWYEQAKNVTKVFETIDGEFIIYKGFKISRPFDGDFKIEDTRFRNMYSPVRRNDLKRFLLVGFIRGADQLSYIRDLSRVERLQTRAGKLYDKRKQFKKDFNKDKRLNEKRLRTSKVKLDELIDLIFHYNSKIQQYNSKYENTTRTPEGFYQS